jgi:segregation and condensation protein B
VTKVNFDELKSIIEGLLFVAGDQGIDAKTMSQVMELDIELVIDFIHDMMADYKRSARGLQIIELAGFYQITTLPEHAVYFERLAHSPSHSTLSQAALETLAIIAYRQPITRAEIEEIRGVKSEKAIHTLTGKKLIQDIGRAEALGRPILYGTTREFMEYFGLRSLQDLPPIPTTSMDESLEKEVDLLFQKIQQKQYSEE